MEITHRTAILADADVLFSWRNNPNVRAFSLNTEEISFEVHLKWFSERLERVDLEPFLVFVSNQGLLGMSRLDSISHSIDEFEISILIDPGRQKLGFGAMILASTCEIFFNQYPQKTILAKVHSQNLASQRLFQRANFVLKNTQNDFLTYARNL